MAKVVDYFKGLSQVYAIVLTGPLARGKAIKGPCIDVFIFLEKEQFNSLASTIASRARAYPRLGGQICHYENGLEGGVKFGNARVDLGSTDGQFKAHHDSSFDITRDEFEKTVGNLLVYSIVLYQKGQKYSRLRQRYLPFYSDALREKRLAGTATEFRYKTWKTQWLAKRGEYFVALDSLLESQRIFLQHQFIEERKYPIDYTKWIKEQCSEILGIPALYRELASVISGIELEQEDIIKRSHLLQKTFDNHEARNG